MGIEFYLRNRLSQSKLFTLDFLGDGKPRKN